MKKSMSDPVVKFFISVCGIFVIFIVLKELQFIFIPFIIAYFMYFVFEPLNRFLINKKIPSFLTIIVDLFIAIGLVWAISEVIMSSFSKFDDQLPYYQTKLNNIISSTSSSLGISQPFLAEFDITSILKNIDYGGLASGFFSSTLSLFSTAFFVLFFFIFVSSGHANTLEAIKKRYMARSVKRKAKKKNKTVNSELVNTTNTSQLENVDDSQTVERTFKRITRQIQNYILTKFLLSLTTGFLVAVVLWLFGVDFLIVWAVLTFLLNFIPNIGSIIAVILPSLMALVQFESFALMLIIAGVLAVVQNIIGNIVEPKIMGDKLGLNPIVILLSLLLWGYIWGVVGMFLSVPLTAIVKITISNSRSKNLEFISNLMGN